jgi:hypothetical protein
MPIRSPAIVQAYSTGRYRMSEIVRVFDTH